MTGQTMRPVEPTFTPIMNAGDQGFNVEQETIYNCEQSIAPTKGQGIPDYINMPLEQYDGIACMICVMLAKGQHTDLDKSVLIRAGIKLDHPDTYAGGVRGQPLFHSKAISEFFQL